jgi:hypothetical protein
MTDERKNLVELIAAFEGTSVEEVLEYERDYQEKRLYIAQKLQERNPEKRLINFHFTSGTRKGVTKEELWKHMEEIQTAIDEGRCVRGLPVSTKKKPIDLKELVKTL